MEQIKDLQEIQIEIKKELGGASLNHLLHYISCTIEFMDNICYTLRKNTLRLAWDGPLKKRIFKEEFILLNDQKQTLNIFAQSEDFQRKLYDAIQIIKNINFNQ